MKRQLPFLLLSFLMLTGCKKEEPQFPSDPIPAVPDPIFSTYGCLSTIFVCGVVTDSLSGTPIEGLLVGPNFLSIVYDTSNADGSFTQLIGYNPRWHYPMVKPNQAPLELKPGQSHYWKQYVDLTAAQKDDTVYQHISAIPYSQLNVHITGNAGGAHLSLLDFAPGSTASINLGTITDTIVSRKIHSNRSFAIKLFADGQLHTTIPYTSQYGSSETIEITYP